MGDRGARRTVASADMAARLAEALAPVGEISTRPMFGGYGVFSGQLMFALVDSSGTPYVRGGDTLPARLGPAGSDRHGRMPYWSVPDHVVDDNDALLGVARDALDAAQAAATTRKPG